MQTLHDLQSYWSKSFATPWNDSTVIGSAEAARSELVKLIKQSTDTDAKGNGGECISALLVGPRGVGKTFVVNSAIEQLRAEGNLIIPIILQGSICSDDKSSMRQIFSQFQRCLIGGSSLDTLTRASFQRGSLSEWCERLSKLLQECTRSDHMVVIVLEDFDQFCHSKSKQSLLYNLFDLMHVPETRFVVIGVTRKPDATETLEKRIKSRFQLRKVVVSPPDSLDDLTLVIEAILTPPGSVRGKAAKSAMQAVQNTLHSKDIKQEWSLYRDIGYTVREFATAAIGSLLSISSDADISKALLNCMHAFTRNSAGDVGVIQTILPALTVREHIVVIGLLKLHQDGKRPKCFAHILKEIESFEKRSSVSATCRHSKRSYWHAFQGLVRLGLIEIIDGTGGIPPPPMFATCRLSISDSYWALFQSDSKLQLPQELNQWAVQLKNLQT